MSFEMRARIASAESVAQRESYTDELRIAMAFAGVELAELKAGVRSFAHCPGLAVIAREIVNATTRIKPADTQ